MQQFVESLGQVSALIGAQWGDEGKGKLTDVLSEHFDVIARGCGGPNTTHTTVVEDDEHIFRLLPSGSLRENTIVVLGAGMIIHLPTLLSEISILQEKGIDILPRLYISPSAHIMFEHHRAMDLLAKKEWQGSKLDILDHEQGITPSYAHKIMRLGLRMEELRLDEAELKQNLSRQQQSVKRWSDGAISVNIEEEIHHLLAARDLFHKRLMLNVTELLPMFIDSGKNILIEGARATFLDTDHGSYPYVTSNPTTLAGVLHGLGLAPQRLTSCIGVTKPYCTRTDNGHFLTEADPDVSKKMLQMTNEHREGADVRFGWLSIPDLHYSILLNGFQTLHVSHLDALDGLDEIPICMGHDANGDAFYEILPGWKESAASVTEWDDLPSEAQDLIHFIEKETKVEIQLIGTGPSRDDIIVNM